MRSFTHCLFVKDNSINSIQTQLRFKEYLEYCRQPSILITSAMNWSEVLKSIKSEDLCLWTTDTVMPFKEFDKLALTGLKTHDVVMGVRFNRPEWVQMSKGYSHYLIKKLKALSIGLMRQLPLRDNSPPCIYLRRTYLELTLKDRMNDSASYSEAFILGLYRQNQSIVHVPIMWHDC